MMTIEFIKKQMDSINVNTNQLSNITDVGYATISDVVNGKRELSKMTVRNYERLTGALFTEYEQYIYEMAVSKSIGNPDGVQGWYDELIDRKVQHYISEQSDRLVIERSGAPAGDEKGPLEVPAHIRVTFKDVDGKHTIRIFNKELYNHMDSAGKKGKYEMLKDYVNGEEIRPRWMIK